VEDNSGAVEIASVHKFRPRTKHINTQYHHFRHYVECGRVSVIATSTDEQCADVLTKSLSVPLMVKHRTAIMGW
uniref:Ty1/Copia family ribonuclease HI n=1 Tax=Janthinobacterium sp. TaxID=1871054 RepID=UPI00293D3639